MSFFISKVQELSPTYWINNEMCHIVIFLLLLKCLFEEQKKNFSLSKLIVSSYNRSFCLAEKGDLVRVIKIFLFHLALQKQI